VLLADSVTVPVPLLAKVPVPLMAPLKVNIASERLNTSAPLLVIAAA
jgi:hypothetical protein